MGAILCGRFQRGFCGVQWESFLRRGALELASEMPAQFQSSANARPVQCQCDPNPMPMQCRWGLSSM
eukprot:5503420-Pyramimonas_sp.AAC.1